MSSHLADLLGEHLQRTYTSVNRLATLSGVPQRTIANWLNGHIHKPHQWQSLVKVAIALRLNISQIDALLRSAGHLPLSELRAKATTSSDRDLISRFHSPALQPAPFQAIADLPTFVGRASEFENIKNTLLNNGKAVVCSLRGMGGVGKTSLAAHLAYQLRDHFPDGVLWAKLDASDPLSILGSFADAYGKDVSQHKDVESRAAVVRNLLAAKRALVILDNAETSAQVQTLLPPSTGTCSVLITTRHGLSALDGWSRLTLEPFHSASDEALQLFEHYLGQDFVRLHRAPLLEVAALSGYLPLALAIVAGRLANDLSHVSEAHAIGTLLDSLSTSTSRLNMLTRDMLGIRASFDSSYAALTPFQQDLFSTLGIFSGEDFGSDAVAYLTDQTHDQADTALEHLLSLSLVQQSRAGRWRLHPLLHDYAREKLETTSRLIPVVEKTLLMYRQVARGQLRFDRSLDGEIPNIRFALDQAYHLELYKPFLETVQLIYPILYVGAWYSLACTALEQAHVAAHALGDLKAEIDLLKGLSLMQMGLGKNKDGRVNLELALQLARSASREEDIADILWILGKMEHDTGYRKRAGIYFEESLVLARKINNSFLIGRNLNSLATGLMAEARYREAEIMFLEALEIYRIQEKDEEPAHKVLINLGELYWHLEDWERANTYWQEALPLVRAGKYRAGTVLILSNIGNIHAIRGEWIEAEQLFNEAIELALEINSPRVEGLARSEYGNILRKQKRLDAALEQLNRASELAVEAGDMERKGITLYYLGLLYLDLIQVEEAHIALDEAMMLAKEINHEIISADIYFAYAKVLSAGKDHTKAKYFAGEGILIYERLGLSRQLKEVQDWMQAHS